MTQQTMGDEKFVPGKVYQFTPPVETRCLPVSANQQPFMLKRFAEGRCVGFDPDRNLGAFLGNPSGDKANYYFYVEWGGGSVAKKISSPWLKVVE